MFQVMRVKLKFKCEHHGNTHRKIIINISTHKYLNNVPTIIKCL